MEEIQPKSWVWRSTEASRAAGQVSVLAVAETLACVAAYWALIWVWGVTWHHWIILIAAPMVLLRSPQSIALGVKWFDRYWEDTSQFRLESAKGIRLIIVFILLASLGSYGLSRHIYISDDMTAQFDITNPLSIFPLPAICASALLIALNFRATLMFAMVLSLGIGTGFWIYMDGERIKMIAAYAFSGLFLGAYTLIPSVFIGIWLRAILTRFFATCKYLQKGFMDILKNWIEINFWSDSFNPPELVPGHRATSFGKENIIFDWGRSGRMKPANGAFAILLSVFFWYFPTLLWRWSIKSTAWFYLPLMWAHITWVRADGDELRIWAQSYSAKLWNIVSMILTLPYLALLSIGVFSVEKWTQLQAKMESADAPMTFSLPLALDWAEIAKQPWLWFYFASYLLTFVIYFWADSLRKDIIAGGATSDSRAWHMLWLRRMTNLRAVTTSFGLSLAFLYVLRAFDALGQFTAFITRITAFNPPLV